MPKKPAPKRKRTTKSTTRKRSPQRSTAKRSAGKQPQRRGSSWLARFGVLLVLLGLIFSVYVALLDTHVQAKFSGKRWAVPARVYARPLELYPGAEISAKQLSAELERLGYRKVSYPKQVASWSRNKNRFLIHSRPFQFWDSEEPAHLVEVIFGGRGIASLRQKGRDLPLMRLEAPEIGSIYPAHTEDRVLVSRDDLPELLVQALLTVEDRSFYSHTGVNPKAIARAAWENLR
ncbi:MAG: transglycosylase domain-containing protein, partial [Chromatiales bacterium]|nr:transglycosylase domain-containing protein [Chromatiales bacterium]